MREARCRGSIHGTACGVYRWVHLGMTIITGSGILPRETV